MNFFHKYKIVKNHNFERIKYTKIILYIAFHHPNLTIEL